MMGGGMMGGMFSVPAEKAVKGKVALVCLDHGLKDPNPRIPYKIIPIDDYAKSPEIAELIKKTESKMMAYADEMEFEKAALERDRLVLLKDMDLGVKPAIKSLLAEAKEEKPQRKAQPRKYRRKR